MKRLVLVMALGVVALTGCGKISRVEAAWTGHSIECVNGVSYVQFTSGAAPLYTIDGKLIACVK